MHSTLCYHFCTREGEKRKAVHKPTYRFVLVYAQYVYGRLHHLLVTMAAYREVGGRRIGRKDFPLNPFIWNYNEASSKQEAYRQLLKCSVTHYIPKLLTMTHKVFFIHKENPFTKTNNLSPS